MQQLCSGNNGVNSAYLGRPYASNTDGTEYPRIIIDLDAINDLVPIK